jgi:hypothetical protein
MTILIILIILIWLIFAFEPNIDKLENGDILLWYTGIFGNRKYIKVWRAK